MIHMMATLESQKCSFRVYKSVLPSARPQDIETLWLSQGFTTVGCIVKEIGRREHQALLSLALKKRVHGLARGEE